MSDRKIIFFDIDGTLYKFQTGIPDDTVKSIRKLKEKGHIPVICTGRTKAMISGEFLTPGFDYIIGGAGTYIEMEGREEFCLELKREQVEDLLSGCIKYGFSPVLEGKKHLYVQYEDNQRDEIGNKLIKNYRNKKEFGCVDIRKAKDIKISKASSVFMPSSDIEGIRREYEDRYTIVNHRNLLLEMIPKGYSKATGIEYLIQKLDIPWENTYAFGDSFNDLEMLQYVKYGICMGNGDKELFQYTHYRTDDFDQGGITNALLKFGLI